MYGYFIHMYVFVSQAQSTCEGQKRESDLLDLQTVVSHYVGIGMDPVSPKKAVSDLGLWTISPTPFQFFICVGLGLSHHK